MAEFRIDQVTPGTGTAGESRHDLVAGEEITLVVTSPTGAGITHTWEILDKNGSIAVLSSTTGDTVTVGAGGTDIVNLCSFLIKLTADDNGTITEVTRMASVRSSSTGLRAPLFAETAPASGTLTTNTPDLSIDNATYTDRAGLGASEQNWRGWAEWAWELVDYLDSASGGGGSPSGPAGGDLDGTYPNPTVDGLQGTAIRNPLSPTDNDVLTWVAAASEWRALAAQSGGAAGGDLSGTYPNPTVDAIQGVTVNASTPNDDDVLAYNLGTGEWTPVALSVVNSLQGAYNGGNTITMTASRPMDITTAAVGEDGITVDDGTTLGVSRIRGNAVYASEFNLRTDADLALLTVTEGLNGAELIYENNKTTGFSIYGTAASATGNGAAAYFNAASGGVASGSDPGGDGGIAGVFAGWGGDGTSTLAAGPGGDLQLTAGDAGLDNGGGGDLGGDVIITAGQDSDVNTSGQVLLGRDGSLSKPALAFSSDPDTGIYAIAAGQIGISTAGVRRWDVSTTEIDSTLPNRTASGTAAAPAWSFRTSTGDGMYRPNDGRVGIATSGINVASIQGQLVADTGSETVLALTATVNKLTSGDYRGILLDVDATGNVPGLDNRLVDLRTDTGTGLTTRAYVMDSGRIAADSGSTTAPGFTFVGDETTGFTAANPNQLSAVLGGTERLRIIETNGAAQIWFSGNGTATDPNVSQFASSNGMFFAGSNTVAFTTAGTERARFNGSGQFVMQTLGDATTPALALGGDLDTGFFAPSAGRIAVSNNGVEKWRWINTGELLVNFSGTSAAPNIGHIGNTDLGFYIDNATGTVGMTADDTVTMTISTSGDSVTMVVPTVARTTALDYGVVMDLKTEGTDAQDVSIIVGSDDPNAATAVNAGDIGSLFIDATTPGLWQKSAASTWVEIGAGGSHPDPHQLSDGDATAPTYSFSSDTNTGIYHPVTADNLAFATGGTTAFTINANQQFVFESTSTSSTPQIARSGDGNTGIWFQGNDDLGIVSGGTEVVRFRTGQLRATNGSAGAPAYSFENDSNSGMYRASNDILAFSTNGSVIMNMRDLLDSDATGVRLLPEVNQTSNHTTGFNIFEVDVTNTSDAGTGEKNFFVLQKSANPEWYVTWDGVQSIQPQAAFTSSDSDETIGLAITATVNQSGTANYGAFTMNITETSTGSGENRLMKIARGGADVFKLVSTVNGGLARFDDGAAGGPSISFLSDPDTGLYHGGSYGIWAHGGTARYQFRGGSINPATDNARSLGLASLRWSTVYSVTLDTGDINLQSQHKDMRDVKYSIVEGRDGLYLRSHHTGKAYRFKLEEVPADEAPMTTGELRDAGLLWQQEAA